MHILKCNFSLVKSGSLLSLALLLVIGCHDTSIESGKVLILKSPITGSSNEFLNDDKELLLFYSDSTAITIHPDYGIVNEDVIILGDNSILINDKEYKILEKKTNNLKLINKIGAEIYFLQFDCLEPFKIGKDNQYNIYSDEFIVRIGTLLDTINPNKVPVEISDYDSTYYRGFINLRQFGRNNEIVHSELFTLLISRADGKNNIQGYILGQFIGEHYTLNIDSIEISNFIKPDLIEAEYINTRVIGRELFMSEELSNEGWGMGSIPNNSTHVVYLDIYKNNKSKIIVDSDSIYFTYGDTVINSFSSCVKSKHSNNYFLMGKNSTKVLSLSTDSDTVFTFNTYRFMDEDDSYEEWYRRDTFKRVKLNED